MKDHAKNQKLSCVHKPLLEIPLENVVLDELHLMLRVTGIRKIMNCFGLFLGEIKGKHLPSKLGKITLKRWERANKLYKKFYICTDVLTNNLVEEALVWDKKDNFNKAPSQKTTKHIDSLKAAINNCGVSFNVWEKKKADGKGSGCYDFTSLMGSDKKILLKELPPKLHNVIKPETRDVVIKIWKVTASFLIIQIEVYKNVFAEKKMLIAVYYYSEQDFNELYKMFDEQNPTDGYAEDYFEKVNQPSKCNYALTHSKNRDG